MKTRILSILITLALLLSLTITASATQPLRNEDITTATALQILRHAAGIADLSAEDQIRYDFNGDGQITTADALWALRVAAGIINIDGTLVVRPRVPQESDWGYVNGVLTLRNTSINNSTTLKVIRDTGALRFTNLFDSNSLTLNTFSTRTLNFNHPDTTWTSSNPNVAFITAVHHYDWAADLDAVQWGLGQTWEMDATWGVAIVTSNVEGSSTITGRRPNGQSISVTVRVENQRTDLFRPTDFAGLVSAPIPTRINFDPLRGAAEQPAYREFIRETEEHIAWLMVNEERIKVGVNPLSWDANLATAARAHSEDQVKHNFMGHTGSNGSTVRSRIQNSGFTGEYSPISETITSAGPIGAAQSWMNSPGHREAMLAAEFDLIGIGWYSDGTTNRVTAKYGLSSH
jgi:uncharacterized protein YkwD